MHQSWYTSALPCSANKYSNLRYFLPYTTVLYVIQLRFVKAPGHNLAEFRDSSGDLNKLTIRRGSS